MTELDREQALATLVTAETAKALRAQGYHHVVVRVAKVVRLGDGECAAPGSTAMVTTTTILPALRLEAQELRALADELEAKLDAADVQEAHAGYAMTVDPREAGL